MALASRGSFPATVIVVGMALTVSTGAQTTRRAEDARRLVASTSTSEGRSGGGELNAAALAWLSGCWQLESGGRRVREHWMPPDGGALLGMSRTVEDGAVVEFEFVRIERRGSKLHYVAKPSGQDEAAFALAQSGPNQAVFEDPQHDFPQRIGYRRQSPDALLAWIEGTQSGRVRRFEFPYQRVPCE